jgi:hypothetical protein
MKKLFVFTFLVLLALFIFPEVVNKDKSLKGEWNFQLHKVWEITDAGDNIIGRPRGLLVSKDGYIYLYDRKHNTNFIFDPKGKYLKSFANRGEGPGEIKHQSFFFLENEAIIIPETTKINYFSKDGKYIKSVKTQGEKTPHLFLNKEEFISAPRSIYESNDGLGYIKKINLLNGKELSLAKFEVFRGGTGRSGGQIFDMIVPGLSPLITIGKAKDRLFYGYSARYTIHTIDLKGNQINSFSLIRPPQPLSKQKKMDYFKRMRLPENALHQVIKSFPDQLTYFQRIEVHNGLIYVFLSQLGNQRPEQEIDIFSVQGDYLYKATLRFGEKTSYLFSPFGNLRIAGESLYVVLEKEDGEIVIAKYNIKLPNKTG